MHALEVSREGMVATVTLVGPGKGNALGPAFFAEMPELFRMLDADEAVRAIILRGSGNSIHESPEALFTAAAQMGNEIAHNPPLVVQGIKQVLNDESEPRARAGLRHVALWNSAFLPSADLGEAFAAFAEKRAPKFEGK